MHSHTLLAGGPLLPSGKQPLCVLALNQSQVALPLSVGLRSGPVGVHCRKQTIYVHALILKFSAAPFCVHRIFSSFHVQVQTQRSLPAWVQGLVLGNKLLRFMPPGSNSALSSHMGAGSSHGKQTPQVCTPMLKFSTVILPGHGA